MKFRIPRGKTAGYSSLYERKFDLLMPILFDDTNLDRMFTQFFELLIKKGKMSIPNKKKEFESGGTYNVEEKLIPKLLDGNNLLGFDSSTKSEVLRHWLEISVFVMNKEGRIRKGEAIDYLRNLTASTYRSGLPKGENRSSNRNIETTIYRVLLNRLGSIYSNAVDIKQYEQIQADFMKSSLTKGMKLDLSNPGSLNSPQYDNESDIDINTVLTYRLIECIEGNRSKDDIKTPRSSEVGLPLELLAEDFYRIILEYGSISSKELMQMIKAIFTLRLYQLPIHMSRKLTEIRNGAPPTDSNLAQLFVDFSLGEEKRISNLANMACMKDLSDASDLPMHMVFFREVHRLSGFENTEKSAEVESRIENDIGIKSLQKLMSLSQAELVKDKAKDILKNLQFEYSKDEESAEFVTFLKNIEDNYANNPLLGLVNVIMEDIGENAKSGLRKYLLSVGGLKESKDVENVWIISGNQKRTETWRYDISDSILTTLLHLTFLDDHGKKLKKGNLELAEVINRLKNRFGVLVAGVPSEIATLQENDSARENLTYFKKRLRQLGWFENLSDDFEAQLVTRPETSRNE